uniref:Uncharacterized protein n=1 Tax=Lepisosteus oculatus TaxID=7918 RepID=W5MX95_LEPOC
NEVRWLSRHFALQAIIRNYEALTEYFEEVKSNDPISKYCHKKFTNIEYQIALEVLNDVLEELAALCKLLQRCGLIPLDALQFACGKLSKLRKQYLGDNVSWSDNVKALLCKTGEENIAVDMSFLLTFMNLLCVHLEERFSADEVQQWSAFDCSHGTEQVNALCSKYPVFLGENSVIVKQYNDFKFAVHGKLNANVADMVTFALQNDLAKLMDIGGTFLASSVDCEQGFSLMNSLKNKLINRLGECHLAMLMIIKSFQLDGGLISLDKAYTEWAVAHCENSR